jgi:hypothetical protein
MLYNSTVSQTPSMRVHLITAPVEMFVDWLYTNKLLGLNSYRDKQQSSKRYSASGELAMMAACAFAHRILASGFQKVVEREIVANFTNGPCSPSYNSISYAFKHLPPESPILKLLVDSHCRAYDETDEACNKIEPREWSRLPQDFLVGVMLRYSRIVKDPLLVHLDACDYHDHISDDEWASCKAEMKGRD